jgi:hypothetical protein
MLSSWAGLAHFVDPFGAVAPWIIAIGAPFLFLTKDHLHSGRYDQAESSAQLPNDAASTHSDAATSIPLV